MLSEKGARENASGLFVSVKNVNVCRGRENGWKLKDKSWREREWNESAWKENAFGLSR